MEDTLLNYDVRRSEAELLLDDAQKLLRDGDFWQHQGDGLAVFMSPGFFRNFRLPIEFIESLNVTKKFYIKPLLPMLSNDGRFYILAVSQNDLRLFFGTRFSIYQMELQDVPTSMQEALWTDRPGKHLDFHTGTGSLGTDGNRSAIFHGQGIQSDEDKQNILRYFQLVNDKLSAILDFERVPMVLAGVDYLLPLYQSVNTYPNLLATGVQGNPDKLDATTLHQQAWELVKSIFSADRRKAVARFNRLLASNSKLATGDLKTAVKAANYGQVDMLFVPLGIQHWGRFEPHNNRVILDEKPTSNNEELLDLAATQTILNSGQVFAVQPKAVPGNGDVAAILRQGA